MTLVLEPGAAARCSQACTAFTNEVQDLVRSDFISGQMSGGGSFPTARQLGTVYSLFIGDDLQSLLNGFATQARAMAMLFAAGGGLIEAQDEVLASALSKASEEPVGLQSLGLINAGEDAVFDLGDKCVMGAYGRVGPEDVSTSPLERIARCADALQPQQYLDVQTRASTVSSGLEKAATKLEGELGNVLGHGWQGDFALSAQDSTRGLVQSARDLSMELEKVATKASRAHDGLQITRTNVAEYAAQGRTAQATAELQSMQQGPGVTGDATALARLREAEEQARAIVNTEYSPAVMDANLDDLDFTAAYRVVSTTALGGPNGIDMARIWNTDGIPRPATAAAPSAAALAAASGGGADIGTAGGGAAGGAGVGATTTSSPAAPSDAATEQALLASRGGGADGAGAIAASAGQAGAGGGVNASTTAAGAPFAPAATAGGQQSGAGGSGIRGVRGGVSSGRDRDRGFGSAAGLVGGGGAAAAGAAASRLGGAGTLAGIGGGAGMGGGVAGGAGAGAFGAGSAGAGAAGSGAGAVSSSSSGGAQAGRAGAVPMGGMAGAAGAGQNSDRRGHTPAGYLTNATNTTAIIGDPLKVSPAVLGRKPIEDPSAHEAKPEPFRGRVIGRDYTGRGAR